MNNKEMAKKPILPLLIKMSVPPIVSMLIQSLYNIIDSVYVAHLSEEALTAVSLAFPLQNFALAVSVGTGVAINARIAKNLGANNHNQVESYVFHGFLLTFIHSILFALIGLFGVTPFLKLFTSDTVVLQNAINYSAIVITLAFGMLFHILIEKILQATGNMIVPMLLQAVGAIINIVLDPILIFGINGHLKFGIKGAAAATIIGQFTSFVLSVIVLKRQKSIVSFKVKPFDIKVVGNIYSIAVPSSAIVLLPSVLVSVLNRILSSFGQSAIAFFGIYYKLQTLVYMPTSGLIQGMRPLISYNYGSKNTQRVHSIIKNSCVISTVILCLGFILFFAFTHPVLSCFKASLELLKIGVNGLRILSVGFIFSSVSITMCGAFEALGKGKQSIIIALVRQFIIILPISILASPVFGLNAIWLSFVISEIVASLLSLIIFRKTKINLYRKN